MFKNDLLDIHVFFLSSREVNVHLPAVIRSAYISPLRASCASARRICFQGSPVLRVR
jgi:hypothetical protein